jgi:hypothetical protein
VASLFFGVCLGAFFYLQNFHQKAGSP